MEDCFAELAALYSVQLHEVLIMFSFPVPHKMSAELCFVKWEKMLCANTRRIELILPNWEIFEPRESCIFFILSACPSAHIFRS